MTRLTAATLLGQNVWRLCQLRGMTLDALAEKLDWPSEALADLHAGMLDIELDQLDEICRALDVAPGELFEEVTMAENLARQLRYG